MDNNTIGSELQKYDITDAAISAMASQYMQLIISGIDDRAGLAAVHEARMVVKGKRVEVEKTRKSLKEDALRYGRSVDAEAKRITALLAPIEVHLQGQEDKIAAIKQAIMAEEEARVRAAEEARLKAIEEARLAEIEKQRLIEEERLSAIAAAQAEEQARLDEVARVQAVEQAKLAAERMKIEADRRAIENERRRDEEERRHAAELEKAKEEAVEQTRRYAAAEQERALQVERTRFEAEKLAAEQDRLADIKAEEERIADERRAAGERPDNEKLLQLVQILRTGIEYPTVSSSFAIMVVATSRNAIESIAEQIELRVKKKQRGDKCLTV